MIDADVSMIRKTIKLVQADIETDAMKKLKQENRFEYIYKASNRGSEIQN